MNLKILMVLYTRNIRVYIHVHGWGSSVLLKRKYVVCCVCCMYGLVGFLGFFLSFFLSIASWLVCYTYFFMCMYVTFWWRDQLDGRHGHMQLSLGRSSGRCRLHSTPLGSRLREDRVNQRRIRLRMLLSVHIGTTPSCLDVWLERERERDWVTV